MLTWIQLQSSVIAAVAYQGGSLFVRIKSGEEYEYYDVPKKVYEELIKATSVGYYYNTQVKTQYDFNKIS